LDKPAQVIREFQKHGPKHGLCTLSKNGAYQVETNPPMQTMQTQIRTTISRSKGHNKPLLFLKKTPATSLLIFQNTPCAPSILADPSKTPTYRFDYRIACCSEARRRRHDGRHRREGFWRHE
jgi:hypothetical protein